MKKLPPLFCARFIGTAIEDFMSHWRTNWPLETVTPKMHILEEHLVPFIQKWKLGCGFYGEQGEVYFTAWTIASSTKLFDI